MRDETITSVIMVLVLTGILPFLASIVLIGLLGGADRMKSVHQRRREQERSRQYRAVLELREMGVNYYEYCNRFEYEGSPIRLLNDIQRGSRQTLENLATMEEEGI